MPRIQAPLITFLHLPLANRAKKLIDTNTPVEITCDTPDVDIYFTLDGSRPEHLTRRSTKQCGSTFRYEKPFLLTIGSKTIRAVAISEATNAESNLVTKSVDVFEAPEAKRVHDKYIVYGDDFQYLNELKKEREKSFERPLPKPPSSRGHKTPSVSARTVDELLREKTVVETKSTPINDLQEEQPVDEKYIPRVRSTFHTPANLLRCPTCLSQRETFSGNMDSFCRACGHEFPSLPEPVSTAHQDVRSLCTCRNCGGVVPQSVSNCLVCGESLLPNKVQTPQTECRLCHLCRFRNPTDVAQCLMCEAALPLHELSNLVNARQNGMTPPPAKTSGHFLNKGNWLVCLACRRENSPEARFCDWCGSSTEKSVPLAGPESMLRDNRHLNCAHCNTVNSLSCKYCTRCGNRLPPPERERPGQLLRLGDGRTREKRASCNVSTQTVGIFYPAHAKKPNDLQLVQQEVKARAPLLTAFSPGRGFWRKQLDHVIAHFKVYTANNASFRAAFGQPRFGKINLVDLIEDDDADEATIVMNFRLNTADARPHLKNDVFAHDVNNRKHKAAGDTEKLRSSFRRQINSNNITANDQAQVHWPIDSEDSYEANLVNESEPSYDSSVTSDQDAFENATVLRSLPRNQGAERKKSKRPVSSKRQRTRHSDSGQAGVAELRDSKLTEADRLLLETLLSKKPCSHELLLSLVHEGANLNCVSRSGHTPLMMAVKHNHEEVIPLLIQSGADINFQSPNKKNTALHEAIEKREDGEHLIQLLLEGGASLELKNAYGRTPFMHASSLKNDAAVKMITAQIGREQLKQLDTRHNL